MASREPSDARQIRCLQKGLKPLDTKLQRRALPRRLWWAASKIEPVCLRAPPNKPRPC
jgi:hypothetical protein